MFKYKAIIAYDGTDYHGWQIQPDRVTVAGKIQECFREVFDHEVKISGASRTDAGVHALGQIAVFVTNLNIDAKKLKFALNNVLPKDILIRNIEQAPADFEPRGNVVQKKYCYYIFDERPLPFISRYGHAPKYPIDKKKIYEALQVFVGTHDFRSFCTGYEAESTIRKIDSIELNYFKRYGVTQVTVLGKSFLQYMIRRIVGASLDIAMYKNRNICELKVALEEKNPEQNFMAAPARGLVLHKINYKSIDDKILSSE